MSSDKLKYTYNRNFIICLMFFQKVNRQVRNMQIAIYYNEQKLPMSIYYILLQVIPIQYFMNIDKNQPVVNNPNFSENII